MTDDGLVWGDLSFEDGDLGARIAGDSENPWLTLGVMNAISGTALLQAWGTYLDIQTRVLGDREVAWLTDNGLGDHAAVLEIGSADGNYGSFLARSFPLTRVFGVEANPHLAKRFPGGEESPPNYSVDVCKIGEDPIPESIRGRFGSCILRFVLQHVSHPERVLSALYDALPVGGSIYVIEEDLSFLTVEPDWSPFRIARDSWLRVTNSGGTDSMIGRRLPRLAIDAGFTVNDFDIVLRNNVEMGEGFHDYFISLMDVLQKTRPDMVGDREVSDVLSGFNSVRGSHANRFVATYPQVLMMATKDR